MRSQSKRQLRGRSWDHPISLWLWDGPVGLQDHKNPQPLGGMVRLQSLPPTTVPTQVQSIGWQQPYQKASCAHIPVHTYVNTWLQLWSRCTPSKLREAREPSHGHQVQEFNRGPCDVLPWRMDEKQQSQRAGHTDSAPESDLSSSSCLSSQTAMGLCHLSAWLWDPGKARWWAPAGCSCP